MPYRVDFRSRNADALDRLVTLGALDAERADDGAFAVLMPDSVSPEQVAGALGVDRVVTSQVTGRDDGSVWVLSPPVVQVAGLRIVPADSGTEPGGALRLVDGSAFGSGLHPTTALCLEALDDIVRNAPPESMLDVGTGSGVLALAALLMGVPRALGIDIDAAALREAAENARINALGDRFQVLHGGPELVSGTWPLAVANVLAAPLIEMAPSIVRRVAGRGQLVLSGIAASVHEDVERAYVGLGMRRVHVTSRAGWVAMVLRPSW